MVPAWSTALLGSELLGIVNGMGAGVMGVLGTSSPNESRIPALAETSICVSSTPANALEAKMLKTRGATAATGLGGSGPSSCSILGDTFITASASKSLVSL